MITPRDRTPKDVQIVESEAEYTPEVEVVTEDALLGELDKLKVCEYVVSILIE